MKTYSINQCIKLLEQNNIDQPKAKYSNNVLLNMLNNTTAKHITVESTKGGFELNRGSVCECLIKSVLGIKANKTAQGSADIDLKGIDNKKYGLPAYAKKIEVKFATSFAPASANKTTTKNVLLITEQGAYIINTADHKGRYTRKSAEEGERVNELSQMLGF